MAFDSLVRSGVALADKLTGTQGRLQCQVSHRSAIADTPPTHEAPQYILDVQGRAKLGPAVLRDALFERKVRVIVGFDGVEHVSHGKVTFLRPVAVTPHDEIIPPDGHKGPVLAISSLADPQGQPYMVEVWIGSRGSGGGSA